MKRRLLVAASLATLLVAILALTPGSAQPAKARTAANVSFTFVNNMTQTVWVGALGNSIPNGGGWAMAPGATTTISVPGTWSGRFWGRTGCSFNASGVGNCETGDCGGHLACNGAGGVPPASLAEFTLANGTGTDIYDVSFVDGFNVPMTVQTVGGTKTSDPYHCTDAGCAADLNPGCPAGLQVKNSAGKIVACNSACGAFNTDQYCCRGAYNTPATCNPNNWPTNYAAYFKTACPHAYSYAYDDPTSTFNCQDCGYKITFGPLSGGTPDTSPPSTPGTLSASGTTSTSTTLSWGASTDNVGVTGYDVIRNGATVATVTGTSTTQTGLTPSTAYSFQVKARDAAGNLSAGSNTVSVTTSAGSGGTNVAQGKPTTASSTENAGTAAANATDGNTGTRWSSAFSDPQWIQVDLGQSYNVTSVNLNWEAAYARSFQIQTSADGTTWTTIYSTTTGAGGNQNLAVTGTGRYVRMYGTARATAYGYSLWELGVTGTPATGSTLLSQGHPATASSSENASFTPNFAVDGNTGTRWSSAFSDPQWISVDLGAVHSINKVVLNWEPAYARSFQIQTSNDAATWSTIYSTTTGAGGVQTLNVTGSGRYVRMLGTVRATAYGYSLWEFQVFGT
jgi:chitodextrinase